MAGITAELLDALLSPSTSGGPSSSSCPRRQAEAHYHSLPPLDRATGLLELLLQLKQRAGGPSPASTSNDDGRRMLCAVLLRREVSTLGGAGYVASSAGAAAAAAAAVDPNRALSFLKNATGPLLSLFVESVVVSYNNSTSRVASQVGHCLAELVLGLSLLSTADGDAAAAAILNEIGPRCGGGGSNGTAGQVASLKLLTALADRAPLTLWRVGSEGLLSVLLQAASAASSTNDVRTIEAALEAVVAVAIASDDAIRSSQQAGTSTTNELERTLLLASRTAGATEEGEGEDEAKIDPNSFAAQLGKSCLPCLLGALLQLQATVVEHHHDAAEAMTKCLDHLSASSSRCPSFLAGSQESLVAVLSGCLTLAQVKGAASDGEEDDDVRRSRLASLEVLAALCAVSDAKRRLLSDPSLLQPLLHGEQQQGGHGVIRICIELIATGVDDDVESWSSDPASLHVDDAGWDDDDAALHAESLLESFLRDLGGGAQTLPVALPFVESLLAPAPGGIERWQHSRAALSVLERCLHAAPVTFGPHVPAAIEAALRLASSSSSSCPRVQYQAAQLLGSMCRSSAVGDGEGLSIRGVRENYGGRILQCLTELTRSEVSKVASHACLALVSYCRGGNGRDDAGIPLDAETLLNPYLPDMLSILASGPLSRDPSAGAGNVAVLSSAVSVVASVADATGSDFVPHYNGIMPGLLSCARYGVELDGTGGYRTDPRSLGHDLCILRGSALEAATIVGQAVGDREESGGIFRNDAEQIISLALPLLQAAATNENAPTVVPMDQLLAACARIAVVMGDEYAPFVPSVLPHLLNRALEKADVSVTDGDEAGLEATKRGEYERDDEQGTESVTVALPGMGVKKLVMNTTQMQEKAQAARAVYEHANALGASFGPYSEACASAFLPLVAFKYSAEVRSTAAQALAPVFNASCAFVSSPPGGTMPTTAQMTLPQQLLPAIAKAITTQIQEEAADDMETLFALADSLSEVLYAALKHTDGSTGKHLAQLSIEDARSIVTHLVNVIGSCLKRRAKLIRLVSGGGLIMDEDEKAHCEEILLGEEELLTPLVDSIGYILKSLKESFVPVFSSVVAPAFGTLLTPSGTKDARARFAAVCLFDDCVEHCGTGAALKYAPLLVEGVLLGMDSADIELQQASVYGVAQIARHARSALSSTEGNIIQRLGSIVNEAGSNPKENDDENICIVENAISALCSIDAPLARSAVLQNLSLLPLREDDNEAQFVHDWLCDQIETGTINLVAESASLVRVFGEILSLVREGEEVATEGTCARFGMILEKIQERADEGAVQQAFSALSPDAQQAISSALEQHTARKGANLVTP